MSGRQLLRQMRDCMNSWLCLSAYQMQRVISCDWWNSGQICCCVFRWHIGLRSNRKRSPITPPTIVWSTWSRKALWKLRKVWFFYCPNNVSWLLSFCSGNPGWWKEGSSHSGLASSSNYSTSSKLPWIGLLLPAICKEFSTLVAPMTEITKLKHFVLNPQEKAAFEELKKKNYNLL